MNDWLRCLNSVLMVRPPGGRIDLFPKSLSEPMLDVVKTLCQTHSWRFLLHESRSASSFYDDTAPLLVPKRSHMGQNDPVAANGLQGHKDKAWRLKQWGLAPSLRGTQTPFPIV